MLITVLSKSYGLSDYLKKRFPIIIDLFNNDICLRPHKDFASLHITMERLKHLFPVTTNASARLTKGLVSLILIS